MTQPLGTCSFLPWLRQGLANQIESPDFDASVTLRPQLTVNLELQGSGPAGAQTLAIARPVALFGPGDIVGIDQRAIVRVEPRDWMTNVEPNYLAQIEFYDEDFPWRYTPAAPDRVKGRLRPWLTLIVLTEEEFSEGRAVGRPLPFIELASLDVLPRADELWAWAHVHVNRSLAANDAELVSKDMPAVMQRLSAALAQDRDVAYSRLLCPRKLAAHTGYHAFVIPTFEAGRRAGLGLDLGNVPATMSAWDPAARPEGLSFPIYHRWFFRTGSNGDFESLVRLLRPGKIDPRVGTRDMDVQSPGSGVRGVDNPALGGILRLGGALRPPAGDPPDPPDVFETWDAPFPRPLQQDLAGIINLPEVYQREGDPDPIITPPLYGAWHALTRRVLNDANGAPILPAENWIHRLNLDPRFRVAAGFGTRVIQDQQERFMEAAWEQVGHVLDARRRIRLAQMSVRVSHSWYDRHVAPALAVSHERALLLLSPLNKRVMNGSATLHHTLGGSRLQPVMMSTALRRIIRPRARLMRMLPVAPGFTAGDQLLARVNSGQVSAATPSPIPPGLLTYDTVAFRAPNIAGLRSWLREFSHTPDEIELLPTWASFAISTPGQPFSPTPGATDGPESANFKKALEDIFALKVVSAAAGAPPSREPVDLTALATGGVQAVKPSQTIVTRVMAGISVPARIANAMAPGTASTFHEPMAYPVIDQPMYEPLKDISSELFLPNVNLIAPNTITLLETNQRFIEAYMVGLNHEFARELLWREYPTDQRGSPFRQFWDARGVFNADGGSEEARREALRDIPPIHQWSTTLPLGSFDHRAAGGADAEELVLAIRGDLLKRYPTAVIYAHRACWQRTDDGTPADLAKDPCFRSGGIDNTRERRLVPLTPAEQAAPPHSKVRTPRFEARIDPDITFIGFDLTVPEARGESGDQPDDDPGWFFVIKERPGEPRFGLDATQQPALQVWNDLAWPDVQPLPAGAFITLAQAPAEFTLAAPGPEDQEKLPQFNEDTRIAWNRDTHSSAEIAYILFQAPVLVGVHAVEMLPK